MTSELLTIAALMLAHELGHAVAATAYGYQVRPYASRRGVGIRFDVGGGLPRHRDVVISLAGPAVNLALVPFLIEELPLAAAVSLMLGLGNLLPLRHADGWRILRAVRGHA